MTLILLLALGSLAMFAMIGGSYLKVMDQDALTAGGPTITVPIWSCKPGVSGSERLREGRPVLVEIDRDNGDGAALLGTVALWGANLHNLIARNTSAVGQVFSGAANGLQTDFQCESIPYAAQANYNNLVIQDGVILAAGAGAGKFTVADVGGFLKVVLGTAAPANSRVEVHRVTPVAMVADAPNGITRVEVTGKQIVWAVGTHDGGSSDLSRTIVALRALN